MNKLTVPGVYVSEQKYTLNPLQIDTRCLCAFAGISEKGPVGAPELITSFDEYLKIYGGFDTAGVLPLSVYSFFKCGGKECIVTRVAHNESVRKAELELECQRGSVTLKALSPGTWGNYICVKLWHEYEKLPSKIIGIGENYEYVELDNSENLEEGDILDFNLKNGNPVCRQIEKIENNRIYIHPLKSLKKFEVITIAMIISGGIGNLIDRIRLKEVVDFISFKLINFPVFNFADICVVAGEILLVVYIFFFDKDTPDKSAQPAVKNDNDTDKNE